jgi:RNA polymerase sigma-70 factor (sigma-E family)
MRTTMVRNRDVPVRLAPADDADSAVAALFASHRLAMVRLAVLLVDDLQTAEDVVQDAFAALHRRWSALADREAAISYLRSCVLNGSRSVLRRRRTVRRNPYPDAGTLTVEAADGRLLLAEEHRAVIAALRRLPRRQREVIVLRYWSDLSEAQIATELGISLGAVKSNAFHGRQAIAAALGGAE